MFSWQRHGWGERRFLFVLLPVLALGVAVSPAFSHGGSAEQLFLPVLAFALRVTLQSMRRREPLSVKEGAALGLCAAAALWYKYTICGFFLGLGLAVLVWYVVDGQIRRLPGLILSALAGAAALSAVVVGWFGIRGGLPALWEAYFVNNLSAYAQSVGVRHDPPMVSIMNNWMWSAPAALGVLWLLTGVRHTWRETLAVMCSCVALGVCTYLNGRTYPYYALILSVYAMLALLPIGKALAAVITALRQPSRRWLVRLGTLLSAGACAMAAFHWSGNVYLMSYDREDMPQFQFAEYIRQSENATVFNSGFLDGGFYFAAGVEPNSRFFCTLNMKLTDMEQEQNQLLEQGAFDYVITRSRSSKRIAGYQLVTTSSFPFEGRTWTYQLYRRTDSTVLPATSTEI